VRPGAHNDDTEEVVALVQAGSGRRGGAVLSRRQNRGALPGAREFLAVTAINDARKYLRSVQSHPQESGLLPHANPGVMASATW